MTPLAFASPEARAFRKAVETFDPAYGFNLHNQHHRTGIGKPPVPAAVSLLVPPIDDEDTQNNLTEEATQVAAYFCERVRARCEGRVSRYEIDYMPRAFGEWSQRQGMATILIEAGGWPRRRFYRPRKTPPCGSRANARSDFGRQFVGTLIHRAISDCKSLPISTCSICLSGLPGLLRRLSRQAASGRKRISVLIIPTAKAGWYEFRDGVIRAIGDLQTNGGLSQLDCPESVVVPGRIVLSEEIVDGEALTAVGATTALVPLDLSSDGLAKRLTEVFADSRSLNAAMVGYWSESPTDRGGVLRPALRGDGCWNGRCVGDFSFGGKGNDRSVVNDWGCQSFHGSRFPM